MSNKNLHQGHRERLRHRFIQNGFKGMYEHEFLEMLLFYSIPRQNTNNLAHALINHFGSLKSVLEADPEELTKVNGIGKSSARFIHMLAAISQHFRSFSAEKTILDTTDKISEYINSYFSENNSEICSILNLDMSLTLKNISAYSLDDIISNKITVRDITQKILITGSRRIIIAINHPQKIPIPDSQDFYVINKIAEALSPLGIELIDSTISGKGRTFSLKGQGAFGFK